MRHFAEMGRKRIALICACPSGELELLRIAAWRTGVLRAGMSPEWARRHCLSLDLETNSDAPERLLKVYREWLRNPLRDADGVILPCYCKEFLAACAAQNVTVPDQLPVIYIGQPENFASLYPQFAILDNNIWNTLVRAEPTGKIVKVNMEEMERRYLFETATGRVMFSYSSPARRSILIHENGHPETSWPDYEADSVHIRKNTGRTRKSSPIPKENFSN